MFLFFGSALEDFGVSAARSDPELRFDDRESSEFN